MMKIKTSELTGAALVWAIAIADGKARDCQVHAGNIWYGTSNTGFYLYWPAERWDQIGPIIEQEGISLSKTRHGFWEAYYRTYDEREYYQTDPTPLIAACRCFVASKLGDEVEIPEELCTP